MEVASGVARFGPKTDLQNWARKAEPDYVARCDGSEQAAVILFTNICQVWQALEKRTQEDGCEDGIRSTQRPWFMESLRQFSAENGGESSLVTLTDSQRMLSMERSHRLCVMKS